jgi:ammonia channel protein AmtB
VANFDGVTVIPGGWLDHNYRQLGIQLADSVSGFSWSFVVTVSLFCFSDADVIIIVSLLI